MKLIWLAPAALMGLIAVVVPILIHLLTNQQTRQISFPTLRFIRRTRLAAIRRRAVQNWLLLAIRVLLVAAAAGALAAPVFVSETRQQEWRQRMARAIVVAPESEENIVDPLIATERTDSFVAEVFRPAVRVADGLRDAVVWLQEQPPAAREVVVVGALRAGAMGQADLSLLSDHIGVRFLPLPPSVSPREVDVYFHQSGDLWRGRTSVQSTSTQVTYARAAGVQEPITVRASASDQAAANAALNAVLMRGVETTGAPIRRVLVVFDGGVADDLTLAPPASDWMRAALATLPGMTGGASGDRLVVRTRQRGSDPAAARLLERIARAVFVDDHSGLEPLPIPVQTLAGWSRPPGTPDVSRPADEGDRRWLWGAALVLIGIETIARRRRSARAATEDIEEARVA